MALQLKSPAFDHNQRIPRRYTGEGEGLSPPLHWEGAPTNTKGYALICEDPDAPGDQPFVHWLIYGISARTTSLPEGITPLAVIPRLSQGKNSFGRLGYGGPMPPVGHGLHHYIFRIYALNTEIDLPNGLTKEALQEAMQSHVLESSEWVGTYERKSKKTAAERFG